MRRLLAALLLVGAICPTSAQALTRHYGPLTIAAHGSGAIMLTIRATKPTTVDAFLEAGTATWTPTCWDIPPILRQTTYKTCAQRIAADTCNHHDPAPPGWEQNGPPSFATVHQRVPKGRTVIRRRLTPTSYYALAVQSNLLPAGGEPDCHGIDQLNFKVKPPTPQEFVASSPPADPYAPGAYGPQAPSNTWHLGQPLPPCWTPDRDWVCTPTL